jgi:hypothetical protein
MKEQTEKLELCNYNKAKELYENSNKVDPSNAKESASIIIYSSVKDFGPTNVLLLENLTGLEFKSKEELYEYFQKSLTLTKEDIPRFALTQMAELLAAKSSINTKEDLLNEFSDLLS